MLVNEGEVHGCRTAVEGRDWACNVYLLETDSCRISNRLDRTYELKLTYLSKA